MIILAIETSCDETAAALVEDGTTILSHVKATTLDANRAFGGVVPDKTAREQLKLILPVIAEAIKDFPLEKVDAIAVTYGPGLIGSLLIGVETAKALAFAFNKPLIPVNHLIGHIYANWLTNSKIPLTFNLPESAPTLPALALVASGAHCDLVSLDATGKLKFLGSTLDDAAGECFDKCGRLLELPYPYGPFIQDLAAKHEGKIKLTLPRPLIHQKNYNFSFSGLKTAFLNAYKHAKETDTLTDDFKAALAFELQEAVSEVLSDKFVRAAREFNSQSLILTGGVAANKHLRAKLQEKVTANLPGAKLFVPPIQLCTDNAAYIASAAFFHPTITPLNEISADPSLQITS